MKPVITEVKLVAAGVPFQEGINADMPDGQGAWLYKLIPGAPLNKYLPALRIVDGWRVGNYLKPPYEDDQPDTLDYCGYPDEGVAFTMSHSVALTLTGA